MIAYQPERVHQPLYDSAMVQRSLVLFQKPVGLDSKRYSDTNMMCAGMLPFPLKFLLSSISVDVTGSDRFRVKFAGCGRLRLMIGAKVFLDMAPIGVFMPCRRTVKVLVPRRFKLDDAFKISPLFISPHQCFSVELDDLIYAPKQKVFVHLVGELFRLSQ